jgi:hypothetical protein
MSRKHVRYIPTVLFFIFGACYNYFTPLFDLHDKERHFAYAEFIAQKHTLPSYKAAPEGNSVHMAYHPPLYYLICALFFPEDQRLLKEELSVNDGPGYRRIRVVVFP